MPSCPKVFTSLDGGYAPGTIVTLLSAAASLDPAYRPLDAYVLDASPTDAQFKTVSEALESYPLLLNITRLISDTSEFEHLPSLYNSHATYSRFQIPELIDCDDAVYMDSDFLCLKDLSSLPPMPAGYLAQAAINHTPATSHEQFAKLSPDLSNLTGPYYNAGFIRFSPKSWLTNDIKKSCLDAIIRYNLPQHDQSALNAVLNGRISPLEQSWNFQRPFWSKLPLDLTPRNYHFDMKKPWNEYGVEGAFQLWYSFASFISGLESITSDTSLQASRRQDKTNRLMAPYKAKLFTFLAGISKAHHAEMRRKGASHWAEVAMRTKIHRHNRKFLKLWRTTFENLIS